MNNELTITEYNNVRVLTTHQIAEAYETNSDIISRNFANNKDRYKEGKHYICLKGNELKDAKASGKIYGLPQNANKFYLWTEKGCLLHAKSLNTDSAWEVYDRLVDTYFRVKESMNPFVNLSKELQAVIVVDKRITEVNEKVAKVDKDLQQFKQDLPILGVEETKITNAVKRKGVCVLGGKESNAYKDKSICKKVYSDIYAQLKRQFDVSTYKAIKRSQSDLAVEIINQYEPPIALAEKIKNCNAQMNLEVV